MDRVATWGVVVVVCVARIGAQDQDFSRIGIEDAEGFRTVVRRSCGGESGQSRKLVKNPSLR
jgi:hypothetical protein